MAFKWWSVPQEWPAETVFIIAGGCSVEQQDLELLRGRKVIALNSSYERAPWADYLLFADCRWYRIHQTKLEGFEGRIVSLAATARGNSRILHLRAKAQFGLSLHPGELGMRRTVLAAGMNLAALLTGPGGKVILLGADGKSGAKGRTHHHHPHLWPQKPSCWAEQRKDLEALRRPLEKFGITVRNASPGSALDDLWPMIDLAGALSDNSLRPPR